MNIIQTIKQQIADLYAQLRSIQEECSHPKACVTSTYHGDTDTLGNSTGEGTNYFTCSLCEHKWSERTGKRWR